MRTHTRESQQAATPAIALQYLREGNQRFVGNLEAHRDLLEQVNETRDGQYPFATILSCIDSRTSAELVFDQGLGDIFSIRIAGTVVNDDILGSMEFACAVAGSKLVVVLGHSDCGAIKGACNNVQMGNLSTLLNKIQPAIWLERTVATNRNGANRQFVDRVTEISVTRSLEQIVERSSILRELVEKAEIGLIGGVYDLGSGRVRFLDHTWMCGEVRHFYMDPPPPVERPR